MFKLHEVQISVLINKVLLGYGHTCLCIVCGCVGSTAAELISCNRDSMACIAPKFY